MSLQHGEHHVQRSIHSPCEFRQGCRLVRFRLSHLPTMPPRLTLFQPAPLTWPSQAFSGSRRALRACRTPSKSTVRNGGALFRRHSTKNKKSRNSVPNSVPTRKRPLGRFPFLNNFRSQHAESNRGPTDYESVALPTELCRHPHQGQSPDLSSGRERYTTSPHQSNTFR